MKQYLPSLAVMHSVFSSLFHFIKNIKCWSQPKHTKRLMS